MLLSVPPPRPASRRSAPDPVQVRESERRVFEFYRLVRSGAPIWKLEEMRNMEVQVWDWSLDLVAPLSPAQALVYALVHDRTDYCRHLLMVYRTAALSPAPCDFCTRSVGSVHLRLAVRYDRQEALQSILDTVQSCMSADEVCEYLDSAPYCSHLDCGDAAVPLAVSLQRSRCLLMLLAAGATANGLEVGLQKLTNEQLTREQTERTEALRCIYFLLLFSPTLRPQALDQSLRCILGEMLYNWLSGQAPPTLLLHALRKIAQTAPAAIAKLPQKLCNCL